MQQIVAFGWNTCHFSTSRSWVSSFILPKWLVARPFHDIDVVAECCESRYRIQNLLWPLGQQHIWGVGDTGSHRPLGNPKVACSLAKLSNPLVILNEINFSLASFSRRSYRTSQKSGNTLDCLDQVAVSNRSQFYAGDLSDESIDHKLTSKWKL